MSAADEFEIDPRAFLAPAGEAPDGEEQAGTEQAEPAEPLDQAAAGSSSAEGIASLERIEQELADVEDALVRLDEGRYGVCEACGGEIADAWLAEHPAERRCADHRTPGDSLGSP